MGTCLTPATDQLTRGLIDVGTRRQLARVEVIARNKGQNIVI